VTRIQLFLSTVSAEFLSYRERLRLLLTSPDVEVKMQEDFIDMTGAMAKPQSVAPIASRYPELASLSYTQWEAWLALLHGKKLYIATPSDGAPRDQRYQCDPEQQDLQLANLARLAIEHAWRPIGRCNAVPLFVATGSRIDRGARRTRLDPDALLNQRPEPGRNAP
jgi:hypothetical protein